MTVTSTQTRDVVVDHLTWTPDGRREPTLRDVSLRIPHGARVALLGASGAGKSTLLKSMIGLYRPTAGRILVEGVDITSAGEGAMERFRRSIGVLFQAGALIGVQV